MFYRVKTGMFAWILFRLTGLALVFYLSMHILVISQLQNAADFNSTMDFLGDWRFRMLEIGLLFCIVCHAMNGIRITIIDFCKGSMYQAKLWWIMMIIGLVLFGAGGYPMLMHALRFKNEQSKFTSSVLTPASALRAQPTTTYIQPTVSAPLSKPVSGCASCNKGIPHSSPVPLETPSGSGGAKKGACCGS